MGQRDRTIKFSEKAYRALTFQLLESPCDALGDARMKKSTARSLAATLMAVGFYGAVAIGSRRTRPRKRHANCNDQSAGTS